MKTDDAESTPRIGFIGLGNMGLPMCRRLLDAGFQVDVHDVSPAAVSLAEQAGATAAGSASRCAAQADVLLTSLPRPDHVLSVMLGDGALAALRPGATWVDLTTNRRELIVDLADQAPRGVQVLDAPVTGAVDGARHGRLTLFVGGSPDSVTLLTPLLAHLGTVIACGPLGTGNVVKLVTNQLWFIGAAAMGEAFAVGVSNDVDLATLWDSICKSVGDSFVMRHDAPSVFAGHYDPSFSLGLCRKDLALIDELRTRVGIDLPLTAAAQEVFDAARARYGDDAPELMVVRQIEEDAGLSFRLAGDWTPPWEA